MFDSWQLCSNKKLLLISLLKIEPVESALIFIVIMIVFWVIIAGIRATTAAVSGEKLSRELREGRVDIVKLFEQRLPVAANEKFKVLEERANAYCTNKEVLPHEVSKFLPAFVELKEVFKSAQINYQRDEELRKKVVVDKPIIKVEPVLEKKIKPKGFVFNENIDFPIGSLMKLFASVNAPSYWHNIYQIEVTEQWLRLIKIDNPYFIAFSTAHKVVKSAVATFFMTIINDVYNGHNVTMVNSMNEVYWLENIVNVLDLKYEEVYENASFLTDLPIERRFKGEEFMALLSMTQEQAVLFTSLFLLLSNQARKSGNNEFQYSLVQTELLLPKNLREAIFEQSPNVLVNMINSNLLKPREQSIFYYFLPRTGYSPR